MLKRLAVLIMLTASSLGLSTIHSAPAQAVLTELTSEIPVDPEEQIPLEPPGDVYASSFSTLHSLPGASKTIFLDFDGHTIPGASAWADAHNNDQPMVAAPYDTDGVSGSFSDQEKLEITDIYMRVAEDFSPFNVDVTTEEPTTAQIERVDANDTVYGTRVLITRELDEIHTGCSCSGKAYGSSFSVAGTGVNGHTWYQPALVFQQEVFGNTKLVAEVASHETGHTVGLGHDGINSTVYYSGHPSNAPIWAPIMGSAFYAPISQWSKGEYSGATNTQDDLADMATHGLTTRTDDYGNSTGTASPISLNEDVFGLIATRTDQDVFSFTAPGGSITFIASTLDVGPNLDIKMELLNSAGTVTHTNNPAATRMNATQANGLEASITASPSAGTNYIRISGVGYGTVNNGYSDYGSLGLYSLNTNTSGGGTPQLNVFNVAKSETDADNTFAFKVTLSSAQTSNVVVHFATSNGGAVAPGDYTSKSVNVTFTPGQVTKWVGVVVQGDNTTENNEVFNVTLSSPTGATINDGAGTGTIVNDD